MISARLTASAEMSPLRGLQRPTILDGKTWSGATHPHGGRYRKKPVDGNTMQQPQSVQEEQNGSVFHKTDSRFGSDSRS